MINVGVAEIRDNLADALNRVAYQGERIVLERRGKGVAVLVSMEDLALLETLEDKEDAKAARKALSEVKRKGGKGVPLTDVKAELGMV
ncbi:MAG: type II toxin-antitoxin system Phd/YefM family antitoxin [Planctomycetota bacterium]|jgi:prevent-host-death family protein